MGQAVVSLLLRKPYFGYILSSLKQVKSAGIKGLEVIPGAVPKLIYNPLWFEELSEEEAYGALLHEMLHLILLHALRRNHRDKAVWAVACDLAVNGHIAPRLLPSGSLTTARFNSAMSTSLEEHRTAEYYYDALIALDKDSVPDFSFRKGEVIVHFPDETEITIPVQSEPDLSEMNSRAVRSSLEEITRQAAEEGEIPGDLKAVLSGVYRSVDVNWRNVLKKYLCGKGRTVIRKTVKRLSKRHEDMPGNRRTKGVEALAAVDESGSISDEDIACFLDELRVLKRSAKAKIQVTRFDTTCTAPVPLERYLRDRDRIKQGGTDYRPVFEQADRLGSRLVILFTDGDGIYPEEAKQKVLWVLTEERDRKPPFGGWVHFSG